MRNRGLLAGLAAVALALGLALWHPPAVWVETRYVNDFYLRLDAALHPFIASIPFAVGDALLLAAVLALAVGLWRASRRRRGRRGALLGVGFFTLVTLAVIYVWFKSFWGFNYDRVPVADKIVVRAAAVDRASVTALANHTVEMLDANVTAAHEEHPTDAQIAETLRPTFEAAIARLGDGVAVDLPAVKPTIFDAMLGSTGDSGFMDPWTHEVNLYSGLLFFERPSTLAHEWAHAAGFADESEANYIAVLSCINSKSALARYSGWLLVWFNLPSDLHVTAHAKRQVIADVRAIQERLRRQVRPTFARAQQAAYGQYLKANRVAEGINSYRMFVRWMTGATYDAEGLPVVKQIAVDSR